MMLTTVEPTRSKESDVSRAVVRRSIREVGEYAHRALVASGATPGEAAAVADGVVHAELHAGDGIVQLAAALLDGAWRHARLGCTRRLEAGVTMLEVRVEGVPGLLEIGPPVIGLAAGDSGPGVAHASLPGVQVSTLLDLHLLHAARLRGDTVAAVTGSGLDRPRVRAATAQGDILAGTLDPTAHTEMGLTVTAGLPVMRTLTVVSREHDRRHRRRDHARLGLAVDAESWQVVADRAHDFLVPDPPA